MEEDELNPQEPNAPESKIEVPKEILDAAIQEALKPIKANLDKAYASRDEALAQIEAYKAREREAELARLEEEGKHREAYEARLSDERAKREAAERRNVELTRDNELRSHLSALNFRNGNAVNMAYQEIVGQLVQNEQGVWVHRSGASIADHVKTFSESEDNAFLFKQKQSSGGGGTSVLPSDTTSIGKKSLFELSQDEVLELAAKGKLPKRS